MQHSRHCLPRGLIHSTALFSWVPGTVASAEKTLAFPKRGARQNPRLTREHIRNRLDTKCVPEANRAGKAHSQCGRA